MPYALWMASWPLRGARYSYIYIHINAAAPDAREGAGQTERWSLTTLAGEGLRDFDYRGSMFRCMPALSPMPKVTT